jgi:hypothetical protein
MLVGYVQKVSITVLRSHGRQTRQVASQCIHVIESFFFPAIVSFVNVFQRLLTPSPPLVLSLLAEQFPFEIATGLNGRVWINSGSTKRTIILAEAINRAEHMSDAECRAYINVTINHTYGDRIVNC